MNERLLVAGAHSKVAVPVSANNKLRADSFEGWQSVAQSSKCIGTANIPVERDIPAWRSAGRYMPNSG